MTHKHPIFLTLIILLLLVEYTGCREPSTTLAAPTKKSTVPVGVIYEFDSTQYVRHRSGFYISKAKDIFQINRVAYDDSAGNWSEHYWLDSLIFYGKYPNKKPLKSIIDLETFVADRVSRFDKDKRHVYYTRASSDGVYRFIVDKADPATFKSIGEKYGIDKARVYFESQVVKHADLATFRVLNIQDSARDIKHVYYLGEKVN